MTKLNKPFEDFVEYIRGDLELNIKKLRNNIKKSKDKELSFVIIKEAIDSAKMRHSDGGFYIRNVLGTYVANIAKAWFSEKIKHVSEIKELK